MNIVIFRAAHVEKYKWTLNNWYLGINHSSASVYKANHRAIVLFQMSLRVFLGLWGSLWEQRRARGNLFPSHSFRFCAFVNISWGSLGPKIPNHRICTGCLVAIILVSLFSPCCLRALAQTPSDGRGWFWKDYKEDLMMPVPKIWKVVHLKLNCVIDYFSAVDNQLLNWESEWFMLCCHTLSSFWLFASCGRKAYTQSGHKHVF